MNIRLESIAGTFALTSSESVTGKFIVSVTNIADGFEDVTEFETEHESMSFITEFMAEYISAK